MRWQCIMAFFDSPRPVLAENPHQKSNLIRLRHHRTKGSKGCLSHVSMLHMMFKLEQCAEQNWRKLRGSDYLTTVITGILFKDGNETINQDQIAA